MRGRKRGRGCHPLYKLTVYHVGVIRRLRGAVIQRILGDAFGVSQPHICNIQLRRRWK